MARGPYFAPPALHPHPQPCLNFAFCKFCNLTRNVTFSFRLQFISVANIYSLTDRTMKALAMYTPMLVALVIRYSIQGDFFMSGENVEISQEPINQIV